VGVDSALLVSSRGVPGPELSTVPPLLLNLDSMDPTRGDANIGGSEDMSRGSVGRSGTASLRVKSMTCERLRTSVKFEKTSLISRRLRTGSEVAREGGVGGVEGAVEVGD
jgi:hypothetical protein